MISYVAIQNHHFFRKASNQWAISIAFSIAVTIRMGSPGNGGFFMGSFHGNPMGILDVSLWSSHETWESSFMPWAKKKHINIYVHSHGLIWIDDHPLISCKITQVFTVAHFHIMGPAHYSSLDTMGTSWDVKRYIYILGNDDHDVPSPKSYYTFRLLAPVETSGCIPLDC
jgi:hypothetical protein